MPTNAQTALTAAVTIYAGAKGYSSRNAIIAQAEYFKAWLDRQDAAETPEPEQRDTALDAMVERADPVDQPELRARPIGFGR
jgi:hypothetical protein